MNIQRAGIDTLTSDQSDSPKSFRSTLFGPSSWFALGSALFFGWLSLTPSLLPRAWLYQAAALGLSLTFGYALGSVIGWLIEKATSRRFQICGLRLVAAIGGIWAILLAAGFLFWPTWQNQQRALVELEQTASILDVLKFATVGVILGVAFVLIGRTLRFVIVRLDLWLATKMPRTLAYIIGTALVAVFIYVLTVDVVISGFFDWANDRYAASNEEINTGDIQPTLAERSGSPDSLAAWDTLGIEGRSFVSGGPTADQISTYTGQPAQETVRVYVGLDTAPDDEARADLILGELERTSAWDREVVIIWATTGTGWVDPDAAETIEYMYGGNTAIAGMQYSYLPSWISFLVDKQKAAESSQALGRAMLREWQSLPPEDRPLLLLFGESLGSFGAEAAIGGSTLDEAASTAEQASGVVLLGPTYENNLWRELIADRDPASPAWRPNATSHPEIVVGNRVGDLPPTSPSPRQHRIAYYHHPSDPVGYWNWQTLWRPQDWSKAPIGYDVSPNIDWYPFVSFWQVVFDLIAGFDAPSGFGHNYAIDMPDAWAAVAAPEGWTKLDSDTLRSYLLLGPSAETSDD